MAETLLCPSCARTLAIPNGAMGRRIRCPACGAVIDTAAPPQAIYSAPPPVASVRTPGSATVALILGICAWAVCSLLAIGAVVAGHMALNEINRTPGMEGRGIATAGLVLGYVNLAVVAGLVLLFAVMAVAGAL